jgi:hypothetical protein
MNDEARDQLPAKTTPTGEMELLISGATIVGLLQLPNVLDHLYYRTVNMSPSDYMGVLMPLWLYSKGGVVTLVLTFLAHLSLRGYWVALVGMNSVYPGGILWENLGLGPITRERFARSKDGGMDEAIERADNRATRVFGVGVAFAVLMLALSTIALLALVACVAVDALFGEGYTTAVFFTVIALAALPGFITWMVDRRFGESLSAHPGLRRAIGGMIDGYGKWGIGPRTNPLIALFRSHVGRARFASTVVLVLMPILFAIVLQNSMARGRLPFGLFVGISGTDVYSATASPADFYEDERGDPWRMTPLPHIPSRIVDGPYLQLYVPFIPRLHGAALPGACPELQGAGNADARTRLDCLARMISLQLDGSPVAVPLDATTDAATGQPGMLAMVPIASLGSGRHELSLIAPDEHDASGEQRRRYRIAFWK